MSRLMALGAWLREKLEAGLSDEEFEQMISASLEQAKRGESIPLENLDLK